MKDSKTEKRKVLREQSAQHLKLADSYAEESHRWRGEVSDGFSMASEGHGLLSDALARKAKR